MEVKAMHIARRIDTVSLFQKLYSGEESPEHDDVVFVLVWHSVALRCLKMLHACVKERALQYRASVD